jgi:hypothetical protein
MEKRSVYLLYKPESVLLRNDSYIRATGRNLQRNMMHLLRRRRRKGPKLAEKEVQKTLKNDSDDDSDSYGSDAVLDPREKARQDKERELKADPTVLRTFLEELNRGPTSGSLSFQTHFHDTHTVIS